MALNLGFKISVFAEYCQFRAIILVSRLRMLQEGSLDENAAIIAGAHRDIEKLQLEREMCERICDDLQRQLVSVSLWIVSPQVSLSLVHVPLNEFVSTYSLTPTQPPLKINWMVS